MNIKTCRHCDIGFYRDDAIPIPHDRCEWCHVGIETLEKMIEGYFGDMSTKQHGKNASHCPSAPHEPKRDPAPMGLRNKYEREIKPGVWVDVYDVLAAWAVDNPALQHLIKKALQPGERGHKTREQDLADIVASARRAQELEQ